MFGAQDKADWPHCGGDFPPIVPAIVGSHGEYFPRQIGQSRERFASPRLACQEADIIAAKLTQTGTIGSLMKRVDRGL
jgi:hypothetical protein